MYEHVFVRSRTQKQTMTANLQRHQTVQNITLDL